MNELQVIRTITVPTIVLDDLEAKDVEEGTSVDIGSPKSPVAFSKQYGGAFPLVQINNVIFHTDEIASMEMRCVDVLPTITVSFNVLSKTFYSKSFPKDGDVMSVFIRSKNDLLVPVHNDYEITSVIVNTLPGGGENTMENMIISGILRVPGFHATKCFSKNGTSLNVLNRTATDLNLGFATNEVDTSDKQTWICPYNKVSDFISDVAISSWKDNKSFYTYFIDHYYCLNFINVEPMFSEKLELEDSWIRDVIFHDYGKDAEKSEFKSSLVLTNWREFSSTNLFIQSYNLQNNANFINNVHGYRRYAMFYDGLIKDGVKIYSDPITTDGSEETQVLMKGRPNESFYKQQVQAKWMGVQYGTNGENCHEKYNIARISNFQNNVHLNKMLLHINLESVNFNLRRMQPVPVVIVIQKDYTRKVANTPEDETGEYTTGNETYGKKELLTAEDFPFVIDKTLSGNYVIKDIIYRYVQGEFKQECVLMRREWPTPPQTT